MEITLEPGLDHCIETVAKNEYERVLGILLKGSEGRDLEDRLELLRLFLESADFSALRSRCDDALLAGKRVTVTLRSTEQGPAYEITIE
jgi:hypothetical protein